MKDGLGRIVGDGVALEHVLDGAHFPGEPALSKGRVHAQSVREMTCWISIIIVINEGNIIRNKKPLVIRNSVNQ